MLRRRGRLTGAHHGNYAHGYRQSGARRFRSGDEREGPGSKGGKGGGSGSGIGRGEQSRSCSGSFTRAKKSKILRQPLRLPCISLSPVSRPVHLRYKAVLSTLLAPHPPHRDSRPLQRPQQLPLLAPSPAPVPLPLSHLSVKPLRQDLCPSLPTLHNPFPLPVRRPHRQRNSSLQAVWEAHVPLRRLHSPLRTAVALRWSNSTMLSRSSTRSRTGSIAIRRRTSNSWRYCRHISGTHGTLPM